MTRPSASLLTERVGGVLTLTLNRAAQRNALDHRLIAALQAALEAAAADGTVRCVVLTGAPPAFCAGLDLAEVAATAGAAFDTARLAAVYDALAALDRPTIAAVNGPVAAGGAGLTCACDIVLAADHATWSYPGVTQGLVAGVVVPGLVRRVGDLAARALLLTGRTIAAAEAQRIGLVTEVVPAAALADRAAALAAELAALPAEALAETKRLLGAGASAAAGQPLRLTAAARAALARYRDTGGP